jgi:diguanylate cyclase (GGDEF)-like protein
MQAPKKAPNELARITNLKSLNILDTQPEERFDRVTRLARRLFDVPIALVSLVDENRQWFKSCLGLDVSETPRDISFCGHAILGSDPFVIPDTFDDERFVDNPLVTGGPKIRFYAGVPLSYEDGTKLGTLCIIDQVPHQLSAEELTYLIDLAKMAEKELAATYSATIDQLTKISNRRGFLELAPKALNHCQRAQIPYSVTFMDLNDFKQINDNFGHQEGDYALTTFSTLLKENFRESDVFARIGGDEFVVFMSGTGLKTAKIAISRFHAQLDTHNQTAHREYDIEFSEGTVSSDANTYNSIEMMLDDADKLMYQNKKNHKLIAG